MILLGCRPSSDTIEWRESVELASGELVQIERAQKVTLLYQDRRDPDRIPSRAWLRVSGAPRSAQWTGTGLPVLLERQPSTGRWVVVEAILDCDLWVDRGRPDPQYFAHEFDGAVWRPIALPTYALNRRYNLGNCVDACPPELLTPEYKKRDLVVGDRTPYFHWVVSRVDETFCSTRHAQGAR